MFAPGPIELLIIALIGATFVGIPAIVVIAIYLSRKNGAGRKLEYGRKPCPECGESIVAEAIKCRFCGSSLVDGRPGA